MLRSFEVGRLCWLIQVNPQCNHKCAYWLKGGKEGGSELESWSCYIIGFEDEGRGHEPRNEVSSRS